MPARAGAWGSALGALLIAFAILKGWWDSRLSLWAGIVYLVLLTVVYFGLKKSRGLGTITP